MKKLILSLAIVSGLSTMAFAQENKEKCCFLDKDVCKVDSTRCKDVDQRGKRAKSKDIKRNKERYNRDEGGFFRDLNLTDAQKTKMQELRKAQAEEMSELQKRNMEKMRAILTPEQIAKLDARKAKHSEKILEGTIRYDAATEAKIKELNKELNEKRIAIKKTRIAPAMMEKKIQDLNEEYAKKRSEVIQQSIKNK